MSAPVNAPSAAQLIMCIESAVTDQGGQCRIVARLFDANSACVSARDDYRSNPDLWQEVGLMNSSGRLACIEATPEQARELKDCEPLSAGLQFSFEVGADEPKPSRQNRPRLR